MQPSDPLQNIADHEFTLEELLRERDRAQLSRILQALLGDAMSVVDPQGQALLGGGSANPDRLSLPLRNDLEPIGQLCAAPSPQLEPVRDLLQLLLRCQARFRISTEMHREIVYNDYTRLQQQHQALQQSEARYRQLSQQLEQRVEQQVQSLDQARRQLYQNEKLAAVGQLAAGMAHEINNPLAFIKGNLEVAGDYLKKLLAFGEQLQRQADLPSLRQHWAQLDMAFILKDFGDLLRESEEGVQRVARIVADLKEFSRIDHAEQELADLNQILQQVIQVSHPLVVEHAAVDFQPSKLPLLHCHGGQLGQMFHNLLINAAQAMTQWGLIQIRTSSDGEQIRIDIEDNGCGIPIALQPRIFEPFYTSREVGQGTGLGLTVSNDIAKAHGGRIELHSEVGKGSIFTILLPLSQPGRAHDILPAANSDWPLTSH